MIEWDGMDVVLIGVLPEISPVDQKKPSMSYAPKEGTVGVGYLVARDRNLKKGGTFEVLGRELRVTDVFEEMGSQDDISLKAHLRDVQAMLDKPGRISEIQAINCTCFEKRGDLLEQLREQLAPVLPEAKVLVMRTMAEVRDKQRHMVEDYLALVVTVLMVLCAAWVGLLAMLNVRERLQEIGILRAIGFDSSRIALLFQGKAVLVGLGGAAIGFAIGTWVALTWGPDIFKLTGGKIAPDWLLFAWALLAAPLFALVASLVPTAMAVTHDPADTLREQ
jgi:ABC-type lipoprotein release transport system permease subunit